MPDLSTEAESGSAELKFKPLPDWKNIKKPFDRIEELSQIDSDQKDSIILWWKMNPATAITVNALAFMAVSPAIPRNEAREIESVSEEAVVAFTNANTTMQRLIETSKKETGGNLVRQIITTYKKAYRLSPAETQAQAALAEIAKFNSKKEEYEFTVSVGKAIAETRPQNPKDEMYRIKAAQAAFDEMFRQLTQARIFTVHDIDMEVSPIIDSPKEEKADLTSTFMSEPWTSEERAKNLRNYKKLDLILDKISASRESKVQLNTLWNWATGDVPQDSSVFKVLRYADELDRRLTEELAPIWQNERIRKQE